METLTLIPLDQKQRRAWIKYQIALRGHTLTSFAIANGLSRDALKLALKKPYPRAEQIIAKQLGLEPQMIWPERYDAQGLPNRNPGRPKSYHKRNRNSSADINEGAHAT